MTTHIVARFADGKLLIQETHTVGARTGDSQTHYGQSTNPSGIAVRMGGVGHITKVLSVTTNFERYGLLSPLETTSAVLDKVYMRLFRGDYGNAGNLTSGQPWGLSGTSAVGLLSGLTSGLAFGGELLSAAPISGIGLIVTVNAIGY